MKELKINPPEGYIIDEEKSTIYNIVFKKKNELPTTWEEFCKQNPEVEGEYFISVTSDIVEYINKINLTRDEDYDKSLLSTKKDAEAHLALIQLHRLRDVYRQGWIPDYKEVLTVKYAIKFVNNALFIIQTNTVNNFLTFQSKEIAEQFLENFEDLILEAKELI
jgi:hypothetical protein